MLIPVADLKYIAAPTVFTVMFALGLAVSPGQFAYIWQRPGSVLRGAVSVLALVPLLAIALITSVELPVSARIGIMLMAISPGAPVALRRSLDAGANSTFAPSLQMFVVALAVVTVPLSVALLDRVFEMHASVAPLAVARQLFFAQLLPLGIGVALRRARPALAQWLEPRLATLGNVLLVLVVLVAVVDLWRVVLGEGVGPLLSVVAMTIAALGVGHVMGTPEPGTRPAIAFGCAMRNPGIALLVASRNQLDPGVTSMILAYLLTSATVIVPYLVWSRRRARVASRQRGGA